MKKIPRDDRELAHIGSMPVTRFLSNVFSLKFMFPAGQQTHPRPLHRPRTFQTQNMIEDTMMSNFLRSLIR